MAHPAHRPSRSNPGRLNVGCGPFNAPHPWWNIDVVSTNHPEYPTLPDEIVPRGKKLSTIFGKQSCEAVYCGHILEHQYWPHGVLKFLEEIRELLAPGGRVAFVGPDVFRCITMWHEGTSTWEWVVAGMEGYDAQFDLQEKRQTEDGLVSYITSGNEDEGWEEARHKWNCYEERMLHAVRWVFPNAEAQPINENALGDFPLVAYTQFQCAVTASV